MAVCSSADRLGLSSTTEYLSRGAWSERGAQYGTFDNTAYSLEAFYRTDPGQWPNTILKNATCELKFKAATHTSGQRLRRGHLL